MDTLEQKTANEVLQEPLIIKIDGKDYQVAPPTPATVVKISAIVSEFPEQFIDKKKIIESIIATAKDCGSIGMFAATLILGETKTKKEIKRDKYKIFKREISKDDLADIIMHKMKNSELNKTISLILSRLEIIDFFAITTSLNEINILRKTKEVEKKTTASGV
jgi:hypothetical protein